MDFHRDVVDIADGIKSDMEQPLLRRAINASDNAQSIARRFRGITVLLQTFLVSAFILDNPMLIME
jgi:hypothetical protein